MAKTSPAQFIRQVRQEVTKVSWPSRKETGITTAMVFVMVTLASIFLMTVDMIFAELVQFALRMGG
ncbi:MAG: preprotein translocase subunit SecE [Alphaproteobacteria bacterium]|nr:preprotein translocase subunit SecE [Alphaproteobacteria bacterium]MDH5556210.1 preprotein translocase subunit SecE [Alphaproteobacteria bacterium]